MKKCLSQLLLAIFFCVEMSAQNIPSSMFVGSVNVKIDGDARSIIEKEIDNLNANPKYLNLLVAKMNLYFPIIEKVLAEEGVPDEFKYLCVQESAFNPEAVSTSNAVGFWQFKRETAQEVGLRVDGVVDERKHIAAATKGAAVYLSRSNLILKNWISTLLSYRLGLGAVRRMSTNDWAFKNEITVNASTDWYVLRFLAYRHFMEKQYKLSKNTVSANYLFEYNNSRGKNLVDIAHELDVPLADVVVNNAWLRSSSVPNDKDYIVYLPVSNQQYSELKVKNNQKKFTEEQISINQDIGFPILVKLTQLITNNEPVFYLINGKKGILAQQGDTPESIATRAGINLKRFLKYNDINENDRIIPNEVYYLKKKDRRAVVAYHTVLGYETLWKISQMYGMQMGDLMEKNRINQVQRLQKGRLLWLIETRPEMQSVEYVQSPDDKKIIVLEDTPILTSAPRQPIKKTVEISQSTTPEAAVFETSANQNIVTASTKPIITKSNTGNSTITTITYPSPVTTSQPSDKSTSTTAYSSLEGSNASSNLSAKIVKNHTIEPRQTLFSIARIYNMSIDELYNLNDIYSGSPLRIGESLKVYQSGTTPVTGAVESGKVVSDQYTYPAENQSSFDKNSASTTIIREVVTTSSENVGSSGNNTSTAEAIPNTVNSTTVFKTPQPPLSTDLNSNSNAVNQSSLSPAPNSKPFVPAPLNIIPNYKIIHTIQAGETIYRVSKLYNVKVDNIKDWNNLKGNTVEIGQELVVLVSMTKPAVYAESTSSETNGNTTVFPSRNNAQYHTMKAGETVFRVSRLYGVTVDEIVRWNNIKNFVVNVGQRLVIKK